MPSRPLVCVIDDDESMRQSLVGLLRSAGMDAHAHASAEAFLASEEVRSAALLVLDVSMPGMTGLQLQETLNERGTATPIVFVSARADDALQLLSIERGAVAYFVKPFDEGELLETIRSVLDT